MAKYRKNCLVVDLNVLPAVPEVDVIRTFLVKDIKLDFSQVRNLQLNISMNQVIIEMKSPDQATSIASAHSAKHFLIHEKRKFYIPLYVEDDSTQVKVHDLPPNMPNNLIAAQLNQYGEVTSIRDEVWRDFFPGIPNGVRVVRIKLVKPIPSFLTIEGALAYVVYTNQKKTCRHCFRKLHPGQKCTATKTKETNNTHQDVKQQRTIENYEKAKTITNEITIPSNSTFTSKTDDEHCYDKGPRDKQQTEQQYITSPAKTTANELGINEWTIQTLKPKRRLMKKSLT